MSQHSEAENVWFMFLDSLQTRTWSSNEKCCDEDVKKPNLSAAFPASLQLLPLVVIMGCVSFECEYCSQNALGQEIPQDECYRWLPTMFPVNTLVRLDLLGQPGHLNLMMKV